MSFTYEQSHPRKIGVHVSAGEYTAIERAAAAHGTSIYRFTKEVVLKAAGVEPNRPGRRPIDVEEKSS